jgi:hypothetical protein
MPSAAPVASASPKPAPNSSAAFAWLEWQILACFTTAAKEVTREQSIYLAVELHRALATIINLLIEVGLTNLLPNIVRT